MATPPHLRSLHGQLSAFGETFWHRPLASAVCCDACDCEGLLRCSSDRHCSCPSIHCLGSASADYHVALHGANSNALDLDKPSSRRWKYSMPAYGCQRSTDVVTPR